MKRSELVGLPAFKSAVSGPNGNCVGWADLGDGRVGLFNTNGSPDSAVVPFTSSEWSAFVQGAASGEWISA